MNNNVDHVYIDMLKYILAYGNDKGDRTGTGTKSVFGYQMRFDLKNGFPLLTTKKVHFKSIVHELLWFLSGSTNIKYLRDNNVNIWNSWCTEDGEVGNMYPYMFRNKKTHDGRIVDQIKDLIDNIKKEPNSRRHLVSSWNIDDLPNTDVSPQQNVNNGKTALAMCHDSFQCYVNDGKLSLSFRMRSSDVFLGLPFNIASYALLTHMIAHVCDLEVDELIYQGGDCHIYNNHIEQVKQQIERYDNGQCHDLPNILLKSSVDDIDVFTYDDIILENYVSENPIRGIISV